MRWVVASSRAALALDGYRVMFLGASVPAAHLGDFLEMQQPLALALSCSIPTALVGVARSVAVAHDLAIPVVGGGRALPTTDRATRLGLDALAHVPSDAVQILRSWALSPPSHLAVAPGPIPEHAAFAYRRHTPRRDRARSERERMTPPRLSSGTSCSACYRLSKARFLSRRPT